MYLRRGRASGLAGSRTLAGALLALSLGALALVAATWPAAPAEPAPGWLLVGRSESGHELLSVPLRDGRFALRYRNSLYGSVAEERFSVDEAGRLVLVELAADEVAVLGEYYEVARRPDRGSPPDARDWVASVAPSVALAELPLLATRHGERMLLVAGLPPLALWDLTGEDSTAIVISAEKAR